MIVVAEATATKVCCRCGEERPAQAYYARSIAKDGLSSACKACLRDRRRQRQTMTDADRVAETLALKTKTAKTCGRCRQAKARNEFAKRSLSADGMSPWCKSCNSDYAKTYHRENKARHDQQSAEWYAANRERKGAAARAWHWANADRSAANRERWKTENPTYAAAYSGLRRARVRAASIGPIDLTALPADACGICANALDLSLRYPDPMSISLDHIVPIARGGSHTQANLQWAHLTCNIRKGASTS